MKDNELHKSTAFHLAGIVPVSGQPLDFNMPWHDAMQPIAQDYLAVERAVWECACVGCETIWIVCDIQMQPLIRKRLGDAVQDLVWYYRVFDRFPSDKQREIPIVYVAINPKDRQKRDSLAWSILYGAQIAHKSAKTVSTYLVPDRYYVAFPHGVYNPRFLREHRKTISSNQNVFLQHNGKTALDGEYLGFSFNEKLYKTILKDVLKRGTGVRVPGQAHGGEKLPQEERWSARHFSLDNALQSVILEEDCGQIIKTPWYYNIDSWKKLCKFLGSKEQEHFKRPHKKMLAYGGRFKGFAVEIDDED